jgi:hypothetical protein
MIRSPVLTSTLSRSLTDVTLKVPSHHNKGDIKFVKTWYSFFSFWRMQTAG